MRSLFLIAFLIIGVQGFAQPLSGTYTIGGSSPDYLQIGDAVQALDSLGINGPVTFNIRNGTYSEFVRIDSIAGISDTSWVTFQSETGDSSAVVIQPKPNSPSSTIIGLLNESIYIRISNVTVWQSNNTSPAIVASGSNYEFYNCIIQGVSSPGFQRPLLSSLLDSNMLFYNCVFTGAIRDVSISSMNRSKNVSFIKCRFYGGQSMMLSDVDNVLLEGCSFYADYMNSGIRRIITVDSPFNLRVINNFIDGRYPDNGYAIEIRGTAYDQSLFVNNVILSEASNTPNSAAILFGNAWGSMRNDIFAFNTIRFSSSNTSNSVFSSPNCNLTGTLMYNNIIVNESGGYIYDDCNYPTGYNLLYTTGAISPQDSSFAQLQQAGLDSHSVFAPPLFDSVLPGLSRAPEIDSAAFPFSIITKDYVGNFRDPNFPDIGPYEFINPPVVRFPLDTTVCENIILNAGNPGSTYLWNTGDTIQTILVDSTASYWVTATNSKGSNTDTIQVYVDSLNLPQYQLQTSFDSLCTGGCAVLSTNLDSNLYQLTWSNTSGTIGTGSVVNACPASFPQKYFLEITDGGTCVRTDSITVFEKNVSPIAIVNTDTTICYGDSLKLSVSSTDSIQSVNWQNKGQFLGSGDIWVQPDSLSMYSAIVDFASGCSDSVSVEVSIHYVDEPVANLSFDTLWVNNEWNSYQWKVNGNLISSANDTFWVAQQNGNYSVVVTDTSGCSIESTPLLFNSFNLNENPKGHVKLYPNPVGHHLTIEVDPELNNPKFEVFNIAGTKVTLPVIKVSLNKYQLNVKDLNSGVYILKVISESGLITKKFSKT